MACLRWKCRRPWKCCRPCCLRPQEPEEDENIVFIVKMLNNITNDLDLLLSEFCQPLYPDCSDTIGPIPVTNKLMKTFSKKPMHFENCSAFGGSSTSGTLTSTDSNRSNKDVRNNGTLTSTDSNRSRSQLSQLDVFGFVQKPLEIPLFSEKPISSRSASSSDLRQISLNERLTKTHQIWNLPEVGRIGAVHLLKDRDIGVRTQTETEMITIQTQYIEDLTA